MPLLSRFVLKSLHPKKPRIETGSDDEIERPVSVQLTQTSRPTISQNKRKFVAPARTQSAATNKRATSTVTLKVVSTQDPLCYTVLYCARSNKKKSNKSYNDGVLQLYSSSRKVVLYNMASKEITRQRTTRASFAEADELIVGTQEVEIVNAIPYSEVSSGRAFLDYHIGSIVSEANTVTAPKRKFVKLQPIQSSKLVASKKRPLGSSSNQIRIAVGPFNKNNSVSVTPQIRSAKSNGCTRGTPESLLVHSGGAIVNGVRTADVVLRPSLARNLRPHQQEGVRFLWNAVNATGHSLAKAHGTILADDMGLGKTLQVLTLMALLLEQSPTGPPNLNLKRYKCLVICPSSLVSNWGKEWKKWVASSLRHLTPVLLEKGGKEAGKTVRDFAFGSARVHPILVLSYEMYCKHQEVLAKGRYMLMVCDEGHRLKSAKGNKTIAALSRCPCDAKVILTGTPLQNNLNEFFAMADFVNPGVLGDLATFRRVYLQPIEAAREKGCPEAMRKLGALRMQELGRIASRFVLRRTAGEIAKFLPQKTEYIVFCRPSPRQQTLYRQCLKSSSGGGGGGFCAAQLQTINKLRQLCNHPSLLCDLNNNNHEPAQHQGVTCSASSAQHSLLGSLLESPASLSSSRSQTLTQTPTSCLAEDSGKLHLLLELLRHVHMHTSDKVVIASNFTKALNLVEGMCGRYGYAWLRLDGSTACDKRGELVDRFNRIPRAAGEGAGIGASAGGDQGAFVFLLSSKAGGTGLNIIGANRIVLLDPDWNPATDAQTMARVWRQGQRKPVFVYRLLLTGTIEEKIFQRQMRKQEVQLTATTTASKGKGKGGGKGKDVRGFICSSSSDDDDDDKEEEEEGQEGNAGFMGANVMGANERSHKNSSRAGSSGSGSGSGSGGGGGVGKFTQEELKELFTIQPSVLRMWRSTHGGGSSCHSSSSLAARVFKIDCDDDDDDDDDGNDEEATPPPEYTCSTFQLLGQTPNRSHLSSPSLSSSAWQQYEGPSSLSDPSLRAAALATANVTFVRMTRAGRGTDTEMNVETGADTMEEDRLPSALALEASAPAVAPAVAPAAGSLCVRAPQSPTAETVHDSISMPPPPPPRSGAGAEANAGANAEADAGANAEADAGANAEADAGANAKADAGANAKADAGANAEADAGANAEADAGANAEADAGANAEADAGANAEADAGADGGAAPVSPRSKSAFARFVRSNASYMESEHPGAKWSEVCDLLRCAWHGLDAGERWPYTQAAQAQAQARANTHAEDGGRARARARTGVAVPARGVVRARVRARSAFAEVGEAGGAPEPEPELEPAPAPEPEPAPAPSSLPLPSAPAPDIVDLVSPAQVPAPPSSSSGSSKSKYSLNFDDSDSDDSDVSNCENNATATLELGTDADAAGMLKEEVVDIQDSGSESSGGDDDDDDSGNEGFEWDGL